LSIATIGREGFTAVETYRNEIIHSTLQGGTSFLNNPFTRAIWLPSRQVAWPKSSFVEPAGVDSFDQPMNPSQWQAIESILSAANEDRITLVHGPPGTGKTTVIATATANIIQSSHEEHSTVWLLAQSNVAVKNIAEKLLSLDVVDFRLLVSKDFHFDWCVCNLQYSSVTISLSSRYRHEHLYPKLVDKLIMSDTLTNEIVTTESRLKGARVILCTLSMIAHPRIGALTRIVPVQTAIVDEASQIEIGNYVPLLVQHQSTLRKLVFVGDDKQCASFLIVILNLF